jgi:hypothetical protein
VHTTADVEQHPESCSFASTFGCWPQSEAAPHVDEIDFESPQQS